MAGIRIGNISVNVTENQLKIYFSNPKNGGGTIKQLLYPLPFNSAVILFDDPKVVPSVLARDHDLSGKLQVVQLPRQVFRRVKVEVDKQVSKFMSMHKATVDELQYIAEVKVDFSYEEEAYVLRGTWFQLEWALHYLDNYLEAYGSKAGSEEEERKKITQPVIKKPNFQVNKPKDAEISMPKKPNKNKNMGPPKADDYKKSEKKETEQNEEKWRDYFADMDKGAGARGAVGFSKTISFAADTNFDEHWRRPTQHHQHMAHVAPMTKGIDIACANLGEVPLEFKFSLLDGAAVRVAMDDITRQTTSAIVSPNSTDLSNSYAVSRAIAKAVGHEMIMECLNYVKAHGNLAVSEVMHTKAGGNLSGKVSHVLHAVGPAWVEGDSEAVTHKLVCTYLNCLLYADSKLWVRSVAMPLISAGAYGFPLDVCVQAFYDSLLLFSGRHAEKRNLREIHLVCFDEDSAMASISILQSLLDCDQQQMSAAAHERYNVQSITTRVASKDYMVEDENRRSRDSRSKSKMESVHIKEESKPGAKKPSNTDAHDDKKVEEEEREDKMNEETQASGMKNDDSKEEAESSEEDEDKFQVEKKVESRNVDDETPSAKDKGYVDEDDVKEGETFEKEEGEMNDEDDNDEDEEEEDEEEGEDNSIKQKKEVKQEPLEEKTDSEDETIAFHKQDKHSEVEDSDEEFRSFSEEKTETPQKLSSFDMKTVDDLTVSAAHGWSVIEKPRAKAGTLGEDTDDEDGLE